MPHTDMENVVSGRILQLVKLMREMKECGATIVSFNTDSVYVRRERVKGYKNKVKVKRIGEVYEEVHDALPEIEKCCQKNGNMRQRSLSGLGK